MPPRRRRVAATRRSSERTAAAMRQSRRGHPGPRRPHARGAAADPRLGGAAGRRAGGHPPAAAPPLRPARKAALRITTWRWRADGGSNPSITGPASSTRCRRCCSSSSFCCRCSCCRNIFLSREVTGKDSALERLNRQIEELTTLLAMERSQSGADQDKIDQAQRDAGSGAQGQDRAGVGGGDRRRGRGGGGQSRRRGGRRRSTRKSRSPRARLAAGRRAEPADLARCAGSSRRSRTRSTSPRPRSKEAQEQDLRSRPAAQSRAGAEGAGTLPLPLRLFRAAAADPRQPARHRRGRRPLRVPILGAVRRRQGRSQRERASKSLDRLADAALDLEREIPPDIPWVLRIDGHTDAQPDRRRGRSSRTGSCPSARAIAVVQYLVGKGVDPHYLAAAGFGEFQPLDRRQRARKLTRATAASS